ncbi:DUF397 domain-containing protein, partial [Streptomyces daliensis]|nr:DUF397 domain-containing protein [Streptomyces daliensis]
MTTKNRRTLTAPELKGVDWKTSSYSGGSESQCVEIADATRSHSGIAIRDSKNPAGPALLFGHEAFAGFITGMNEGR